MTAALRTKAAPYVLTASGRSVSLAAPDAGAISMRDVAAHLSKICRFAGACNAFYSVAQHSILVSNLTFDLGPDAALYGLLHDAHEAYIGDITQPAKVAIGDMLGATSYSPIDEIAQRLDRAVYEHVGLPWPVPARIKQAVHHADLRALATERRDLMADGPEWEGLPAPWRAAIKPWPWVKAEEKFLELFDDLAAMAGVPTLADMPR